MGAGANDIRAGKAFVEINARDLTRAGLDAAEKRLRAFGRIAADLGKGLLVTGGALLTPFTLIGRATENIGKQIRDTANQTHQSIENVGRRMGFNPEESRNAVAFAEAMEEVEQSGRRVMVTIGGALLPTLRDFADGFTATSARARAWIKDNGQLILLAVKLGVGLVAAGAALLIVGKLLGGAAFIIGGLVTAIGLLLTPVGLLAVALVGLAAWFLDTAEGGREMAQGLWSDFRKSFGAIIEFLKAGQIEKAWKVLWVNLKIAFLEFRNWLDQEWGKTTDKMVDDARTGTAVGLVNAMSWIAKRYVDVIESDADKRRERIERIEAKRKELEKTLDEDNRNARAQIDQRVVEPNRERLAEIERLKAERLALLAESVAGAAARAVLAKVGAAAAAAGQVPPGANFGGLGTAAKGLFSSSALSQSLAISDKFNEPIKAGLKAAVEVGQRAVNVLERIEKQGGVFV